MRFKVKSLFIILYLELELERGLATASILHKTKSKEQHLPSCGTKEFSKTKKKCTEETQLYESYPCR